MTGAQRLCFYLFVFLVVSITKGYKIQQGAPLPILRNTPFVYRGPAFIVQETDDVNEPYIAQIVEGSIEMVQPHLKAFRKPLPIPSNNESFPELQDDPEYFAVLVTPETVAQAQISRTTTITIPLPNLLLGVSSRIPWVMVLKRQNHFDYFRNLTPAQIPLPQRRRSRSQELPNARLITDSKKYDLILTEDDKSLMNSLCVSILQELVYLNTMLQTQTTVENESYNPQSFDSSVNKKDSTTGNLKYSQEELNETEPTDDQSIQTFFQMMSSMLNNNTRSANESSKENQKMSP